MNCKICKRDTGKIFEKKILRNYNSAFYLCEHCGFMQTDEPVWLPQAYSTAITSLDIGLVNRNIVLKEETELIIDGFFPEAQTFLDYAGGYGLFVRMMRDSGFNFYREDIYCENLFARHFDIRDANLKKFDVVTAFEVFEHFADPLSEIEKIFQYSDNIIFSTKLIPDDKSNLQNWWYLSTDTGQHIAFYQQKTLKYIAELFKKNYYFNGKNIHIVTSQSVPQERIAYAFGLPSKKKGLFSSKKPPVGKVQRRSLLDSDYEHIRHIINK